MMITACGSKKSENDIDAKEIAKLIDQAIIKMKNDIEWGKNGSFALGEQYKVEDYGRMGAGTGYQSISDVVLERAGIYDESKKKFTVRWC